MNKRPCTRTQTGGNEILPGEQDRRLWEHVENLSLFTAKNKLNRIGHNLSQTNASKRRFWLHYRIVRFYKFKTSDKLAATFERGHRSLKPTINSCSLNYNTKQVKFFHLLILLLFSLPANVILKGEHWAHKKLFRPQRYQDVERRITMLQKR